MNFTLHQDLAGEGTGALLLDNQWNTFGKDLLTMVAEVVHAVVSVS